MDIKRKIAHELFNWAKRYDSVTSKSALSAFLAVEIDERFGHSKNKKPTLSAKTLVRLYNGFIESKPGIRISVKTWDLVCRFLGYASYADYAVQHGQTNPNMVALQLTTIDFEKKDQHNEWPIYQVAYLWYGFEPPNVAEHFFMMTGDIATKKMELHLAVDTGRLQTSRTYTFVGGLTRYVTRKDLVAYAKANEDKPKFLFKELR